MQLLYFRCQPRVAHRSAPRKFFGGFFYKCILQGTIDFAEAAVAEVEAIAKQLEEWESQDFKCQPRIAHRSPPRSFCCKCILQAAIDFAAAAEAELEAWSKWLGWDFKRRHRVAHRSPPCKFFGVAICLILRCCGSGVAGRGANGLGFRCNPL